jgi:hypothetical protein
MTDAITHSLCMLSCSSKSRWIVGPIFPPGPYASPERLIPGVNVRYHPSKQGWITSAIVCNFIRTLDSTLSRSVLLVTGLLTQAEVGKLACKFVTVLPVSQNENPDIHTPMSQTILKVFRARYRLLLLTSMVETMSDRRYLRSPTLRQVAGMILKAWSEIPAKSIKQAFVASTILPKSFTLRAVTSAQKNVVHQRAIDGASEHLATVVREVKIQLHRYRHELLGGYMFGRELGLIGAHMPPANASADRLVTLAGEDRVVYNDALDSEIIMSVSGVPEPSFEAIIIDEPIQDVNGIATVSNAGGNAKRSRNGGAGVNASGFGDSAARAASPANAEFSITSRESARRAVEKLLAFFRSDGALHTEDTIYMCSALHVELSKAIKKDKEVAAESDAANNQIT